MTMLIDHCDSLRREILNPVIQTDRNLKCLFLPTFDLFNAFNICSDHTIAMVYTHTF